MGKGKFVPIVVLIVGALIVAGLFVFQKREAHYEAYIVGNLVALMFIPMLTILGVFREEPSKFGFCLGDWSRIWVFVVACFVGLFGFLFLLKSCDLGIAREAWMGLRDYYPIFKRFPAEFGPAFRDYPRVSPWVSAPALMLYAEATYGMYLFCWEFFFRGYLLSGLHRYMGWWAVIVQAIGFGLLHYGKVPAEFYVSFGAGIILGIIALKAKSFVPCFVLHWAASIGFDIMIIATRHTGMG